MKSIAPLLWAVVFLAVLDVTVNVLTRYPLEPTDESTVGPLQRYFNYGRSVESKLRWMTAESDDRAHPLARSGWLAADRAYSASTEKQRLIAVYGMSFSQRIGAALERLDERFVMRFSGGPGATVGRSYADYLLDRGNHDASIVMLAILASSVPATGTVTHMTWNFEAPSPHFYPKFVLSDSRLSRIDPPVSSLAEFRRTLGDATAWERLVAFLAAHDDFYDRWSFGSDPLDYSIMARLIRRAWAQAAAVRRTARFHNGSGFTDYGQTITTTLAIIEAFGRQAEQDGQLPMILLFNDHGFSDHLYQALHGRMDELGILYLSSHEVVRAEDLSNFLPDGHFRPELDREIAVRLSNLIDANASP